MNGAQLVRLLEPALGVLEQSEDELRDLDAAIGDGDLGVTISRGARAARDGLAGLTEPDSPATVLREVAKRFANANPSTMAALTAAGLLAGARALGEQPLNRATAQTLVESAMAAIQSRGKADLGDKTILDAMQPSIDALRAAEPDDRQAMIAMIAAAQKGVEETAGLQSRRGRAAWVGERTVGHPDAGATAYVRLLEALAEAMAGQTAAG